VRALCLTTFFARLAAAHASSSSSGEHSNHAHASRPLSAFPSASTSSQHSPNAAANLSRGTLSSCGRRMVALLAIA
jgi:hypothetical protein